LKVACMMKGVGVDVDDVLEDVDEDVPVEDAVLFDPMLDVLEELPEADDELVVAVEFVET
jgi:hypothetical protein